MGNVNKVILVGNLGSDPEIKVVPSGQSVCNISVATNDQWKDKTGQKHERTEWHRVAVWGAQAEPCSKYLAKGSAVYVEGRLQSQSWEDKDGHKRTATDVIAERVVFLGRRHGAVEGGEPDVLAA